jgi:hypothetical protein
MIDHRASTSIPVDFSGMPGIGQAPDGRKIGEFYQFEGIFPTQHTPVPAGYNGFLLFLDEFNAAPKSVTAASYKLVLDRMVGQEKLHDDLGIILAGNRIEDNAIVNEIGSAMRSRVIHLNIRDDFDEFMEDVVFAQNWDHRVIAYLQWKGINALSDFNPEMPNDTFCCPRTWDFFQKLIKGKPVEDSKLPMYTGTISKGVAIDFVQFSKVYANLHSIRDVVANPKGLSVPSDAATQWALLMHLANEVDEKTFEDVKDYIDRFPTRFKIVFYRSVVQIKPQLTATAPFRKAMGEMSRYLNAKAPATTAQTAAAGSVPLPQVA